jgi:hypothetical protein
VSGTHVTKLKEAPRLDREPWTPQFLASLLRNASKAQDAHRKRGHEEGFAAAREVFGAEAVRRAEEKAFQAEEKLKDAERESKWQRRDLEALRERVANFERHAGLPPNTIASDPIAYGGVIAPGAGATFLAAQQIRHLGTERVISKLLAAVEALRALPEPPRPPEATSERTDPS